MERYFSVPVSISHALVLHRLEFRNRTTRLSDAELARWHAEIDRLVPQLLPDVCFLAAPIAVNDGCAVSTADGLCIESRSACELLQHSSRLLLMASVCHGAAPLVDAAEASGDLARAAFVDAVASETADAGLDWIASMLKARLLRQGCRLTTRFSAGYGDVPLSLQKVFFDRLDLAALGASISERFMLTPQKSVIAFAGVIG